MRWRILMMSSASLLAMANSTVSAQSTAEARTRISGFVSGLIGDGGTRPVFGLSAGYRLTRFIGFEFDAGYTSRLNLGEENRSLIIPAGGSIRPGDTLVCAIPEGCPITQRLHDHGSLFIVTTNAVIDLPTCLPRLRPYLVAGAGAGNLSRDIDYMTPADKQSTTARNNDTRPVLDIGGGVDLRKAGGLEFGVDARFFQFFGSDTKLKFARVGVRLSYRF